MGGASVKGAEALCGSHSNVLVFSALVTNPETLHPESQTLDPRGHEINQTMKTVDGLVPASSALAILVGFYTRKDHFRASEKGVEALYGLHSNVLVLSTLVAHPI